MFAIELILSAGLMVSSASMAMSADPFVSLDTMMAKVNASKCESLLAAPHEPLLLVIGLGNMGYDGTRHNVGADLLRTIEARIGASDAGEMEPQWLQFDAPDVAAAEEYLEFSGASNPRLEGQTVHYRVGGRILISPNSSPFRNIVFIHPLYDINESGHFVAQVAARLKVSPQDILVVTDDLRLPRNQIQLSRGKPDGTGDGHNGVRSINAQLGRGDYLRLRIGISTPKAEKVDSEMTDWVLGPVPATDRAHLLSDDHLDAFMQLILNIRTGLNPETHQQVNTAERATILKRLR